MDMQWGKTFSCHAPDRERLENRFILFISSAAIRNIPVNNTFFYVG